MSRYNDLGRDALFIQRIEEFETDTPFKPRHRKWYQLWRYW